MNVTIAKTELAAALAHCAAIAATSASMPTLANVLLSFNLVSLRLFATDLETGYETTVNYISIDEETIDRPLDIFTLPAKKLNECVKAIPVPDVIITINDTSNTVTIAGGTALFTLERLDADGFPSTPTIQGNDFDIDAPALVKIIESVTYAQCKDRNKYHLCSVFLKAEANMDDELFLTAAATDGHRLAVDSVPLPGEPREVPKDLTKGIIIASKGIDEICKIKTPGVIVLSIAGNNLCIATDNEKLYIRLVDGQYPDYGRIIPTDLDKRIEVKRQALIDSLERVRIMTVNKSRGCNFDIGDSSITITADLVSIGGHAEDKVAAVIQADPFTMRINAEYLLATLENMPCGTVEISIKDPLSPLRINPLGTDEPIAIIMPMRES